VIYRFTGVPTRALATNDGPMVGNLRRSRHGGTNDDGAIYKFTP
jgi:hypothetical protein